MSGTIHFYGERGLVNATLLDLRTQGKLAAFLRAIEFPFRQHPHLDIADRADITMSVEASFGGTRPALAGPTR
jgi:hypothetical protein